jgi:hypothetical protein
MGITHVVMYGYRNYSFHRWFDELAVTYIFIYLWVISLCYDFDKRTVTPAWLKLLGILSAYLVFGPLGALASMIPLYVESAFILFKVARDF